MCFINHFYGTGETANFLNLPHFLPIASKIALCFVSSYDSSKFSSYLLML